MGALTISDLTPMAGEPCVRDARLGEVLGFARPRDLRQLIKANLDELMTHGPSRRVTAMVEIGSGARRAVEEYHLNEAQALLVCMFARTEKAAAVRKQVIQVFLAWRHGELTGNPPADRTVEVLNRLEARLGALETAGRRLNKVFQEPLEAAIALTHSVDLFFEQSRQRRPKFWGDMEVRGLVLATHRQMSVDEVHALIVERCGAERAPSRSAIHRFWLRLDRLKAASPSLRLH